MEADLLRGNLDGLILAVLDDGPRHGYSLIEAIHDRSGGAVTVPAGSVYPAMRRLERAGLVTSEWSDHGGRRRRTYAITPAGREHLAGQRRSWQEVTRVLAAFSLPAPQAQS
jgi:PadR family transcriptional regulator, regulatory protein PadR